MLDPQRTPPEKRYQQVSQEETQQSGSLLYKVLAGLGAITLGSLIYKRATGGNAIADLLHFTGNTLRGKGIDIKYAANEAFGGSAGSAGRRNILDTAIDVRTGGLKLDQLDIVKDIVYSDRVMAASSASDQRSALSQLIKDKVRHRFAHANEVSFFGQKLERLTVGEVLDSQADFFKGAIGGNNWQALKTARDRGILQSSYVLDKRIYKTATGIRDTRLKPLAQGIFNNFDFLGLSRVAKSALFGADVRYAALPGLKSGDPLRFFIDGSMYDFSRQGGKLVTNKLADKVLLREAGDPLQVSTQLRQGVARVENPTGGLWAKLQSSIGVGPAYRNRDPLLKVAFVNPFKRLRALESGEGIVYRKEYVPEDGQSLLSRIVNPDELGVGTLRKTTGPRTEDFKKLGWWDRFHVMFGSHEELTVLKSKAYQEYTTTGKLPTNKDLIIPSPTGGLKAADTFYQVGSGGQVMDSALSYTGAGALSRKQKSKYYAAPGSITGRVLDFANYTLTRLNSLASSSGLGIGFKVSGSLTKNIARLAAIPIVYETGRQFAGYADYFLESTIGVSPLKLAASAYSNARVMQQKARELTGIQQGAKYLEENFPGSVNSEMAFGARTAALPFLSFMAGIKKGLGLTKSGLLAGALGLLFGGPTPDQPAAELQQEYEGTRKVPVRRGRFYGGGYQPFGGGDIQYYDYNPIYKIKSDYKDRSLYGSRQEYYSKYANVFGVPLPTPSNLFGLRNLTNLYGLEQKHYYDRPYSETAGLFNEMPLVGPLLSATAGSLIKPKVKMHVSELYGIPSATASLIDRYMPPNVASRLGIPDLPISQILMQDASDPMVRLQQQAAIASEPLGIYKWIMQYFGVNLDYNSYGSPASADVMGSVGRGFYDADLGGLFSQSEAARRIFLAEKYTAASQRQLINPLRNMMPTWLPGSASEESGDKDYFFDFQTGDPFAKLESGESRLPGCITPDTIVITKSTAKKAKDITIGDEILTKEGFHKVWNIFPRTIDEEIKIITAYSGLPVKVTKEHLVLAVKTKQCKYHKTEESSICRRPCKPFFNKKFCEKLNCTQFNDYNVSWEEAGDIVEGDYLVLPKIKNEATIEKLDTENLTKTIATKISPGRYQLYTIFNNQHRKGRTVSFPDFIELDKEFMYFAGFFLAEGNDNGTRLVLTCSLLELNILEKIKGYMERTFKVTCTISSKEKYGAKCLTLSIYSKMLTHIVTSVFGKTTSKNIPLNLKNTISLIGGLYEGDGHLVKENIVLTASAQYRHTLQIPAALLALGISYSIRYRESRGTTTPTYEITIDSADIKDELINKRLDTYTINKTSTFIELQDYFLVKVRKTEIEHYSGQVLDFGVENIHNYVTSFIMHNSGLESLRPLHSGMPGVYSDVDRLLVLADVAPYSQAYEKYKQKVGDPSKYGDYWGGQIAQAIQQRDTIVNQLTSYPRADLADLNEKIKAGGFKQVLQKGWDTLTHDVLAEIPYFGSKFAPFRSPIERYEKEQIYGDSFLDWNRPWETVVRPAIYDAARSGPIAGAAKGAILGALMSKTIPGLGGEMFNPVVPLRQGNLAIPIGAAAGAGASLVRSIFTGKNFIPPHKQEEIEAQDYMDKIIYAKARSYEIAANDIGDKTLASSYRRMANTTLQGAMDDRGIKAAMSSMDRKYFDSFVNTPNSERSDLLRRLPTYYGQQLRRVWEGDYGTIEEHDQDTLDYFSDKAMLDQDSLLWHPSVPTDVMKIKMIEGGINGVSDNLHRFGFYESQGIEASARFPDVNYSSPWFLNLPNTATVKHNIMNRLRSFNPFNNDKGPQIDSLHTNQFNQIHKVNQKVDRSSEVYTYMSDTLR